MLLRLQFLLSQIYEYHYCCLHMARLAPYFVSHRAVAPSSVCEILCRLFLSLLPPKSTAFKEAYVIYKTNLQAKEIEEVLFYTEDANTNIYSIMY